MQVYEEIQILYDNMLYSSRSDIVVQILRTILDIFFLIPEKKRIYSCMISILESSAEILHVRSVSLNVIANKQATVLI